MTLLEIRTLVQKLVASAQLTPAIACMRAYLSKAHHQPDLLNSLLALESRHSRNEQLYTIQRSIQLEDYQTETNSLVVGLLALVDEFPAESAVATAEIEQLLLANNLNKKQVGKILYSIPTAMQVQIPVICTIRIAPEEVYEAVLRDGIDETNSTHIERLQRISEVMKVELREVGSGYFEIIPITSDLEQIIYPNEYTEWLFQVTPLQTGIRTLTLEVSVVEILKEFGERRKSVKTLVRKIEVVTTEVVQEPVFEESEAVEVAVGQRTVPKMQPAGIVMPTEAQPAEHNKADERRDQTNTHIREISSSRQQMVNRTKIMGTVTAVAVLVVGGWFFFQAPTLKPTDKDPKDVLANNQHPNKGKTDTQQTAPLPIAKDPFANQLAQNTPGKDPDPLTRPSHLDVTQTSETDDKADLESGQTGTLARPGNAQTVFAKISNVATPESGENRTPATLTVEFALEIDANGKVTGHQLVKAGQKGLAAACERKLSQLKYTPATEGGKPRASSVRLTLLFRPSPPDAFVLVSAR